jgi:uncharacterized phage protein gp47/JayE
MAYGIDENGFNRKDLTSILTDLNKRVKGVFGDGLNLAAQSPQGQINGIFAEAEANLWEAIQAAYDSFNPQAAAGIVLSNLVTLNGIERKPATKSTVTLTFTGTNGATIPAGSKVKTSTGTQWETIALGTISGTTAVVGAQSVEFGAVSATSETITQFVDILSGVNAVTNYAASQPGTDIETDEDLRVRRYQSVAFTSQSMVDSIYAGVANIENVDEVIVLENDTDSTDANGLLPHSIHVITKGGDNTEIATEIYNRKPVGIYTNGSTLITVADSQAIGHPIRFSIASDVTITVVVNITTDLAFPTDGVDQIKAALVAFAKDTYDIGDDVYVSRLYTPVNSVPGHYVTSMTVNGDASVAISVTQRAAIAIGNITVNVT